MTTIRSAVRQVLGVASVLAATLAAVVPAAAIDRAGHWLVEGGDQGPAFVEVAQVGDTISVPADAFSPASGTFAGTVTGPGDFLLAGAGDCMLSPLYARLVPGGTAFHGVFATVCPSAVITYPTFTRCTCFDGNMVDGDGCDASCQTEPCFTCSGDPSTCTPSADGQSCDDRHDCTSGETCAAGVCGGGAPVTPCVDMTGSWHVVETVDALGVQTEYDRAFAQRGGIVRTGGYIGTIDLATGAFDLSAPTATVFVVGGTHTDFFPLAGTAGPTTFTGVGMQFAGQTPFSTHLSAVRSGCGDGAMGPGEQCDDGGTQGGDGCDAFCQLEPCHVCSGAPSTCVPLDDGTPCSDGDACTAGDACAAGSCLAGAATSCGPCTACAPDTGSCVAAPRLACRAPTRSRASTLAWRDAGAGGSDLLRWSWTRGAATTAAELGDPIAGDDVALCVFDDSTPTPSLRLALAMPGGGTCNGVPCWRPHRSAGLSYRARDAAAGETVTLTVDPGPDGVSRAKLTARGPSLAVPAPPVALPLRAQLQMEHGTCFEARYDAAGVSRNAGGTFRAASQALAAGAGRGH